VADRSTGRLSADWTRWILDNLLAVVQQGSQVIAALTNPLDATTSLAAAVPWTTVFTVPQRGIYRIAWSEQITQAATSSSAIQLTVQWTANGIQQTGGDAAALTTNATTSHQEGSLLTMVDSGTTIRYQTTYSSSGATPMQYRVAVTVELVN
jgi:hypothetical protein